MVIDTLCHLRKELSTYNILAVRTEDGTDQAGYEKEQQFKDNDKYEVKLNDRKREVSQPFLPKPPLLHFPISYGPSTPMSTFLKL
jgi:hypothetical protein